MTICTVITCYYESGLQINVSKTRAGKRGTGDLREQTETGEYVNAYSFSLMSYNEYRTYL